MAFRNISTFVIVLLAAVLTSASPRFQPLPIPPNAPQIDLNYTRYVGTRLPNGVNAFLGMRYAAAPVGDLRWRAPVEPRPSVIFWEPALKFQPACLGNAVPPPYPGEDEDCLFVNVWTPSNATPASKLPVWVFIQGGGKSTVSLRSTSMAGGLWLTK